MIQIYIALGALALLSGALTVWIARRMFDRCDHRRDSMSKEARHDLRHDGNTPGMLHFVDPYISGLVEDLYHVANTGKKNTKEQ